MTDDGILAPEAAAIRYRGLLDEGEPFLKRESERRGKVVRAEEERYGPGNGEVVAVERAGERPLSGVFPATLQGSP